jgi:N-acetylglucosamine-6-phosphate deacetylase
MGRRNDVLIAPGAVQINATGKLVVPGFINMHVHGAGGFGALDGNVSSLLAISRLFARHGVTSWLPTTGTAPLPQIEAAIQAVEAAQTTPWDGAEVLGIHIEGPFLNPQQKGAHPEHLLMTPTAQSATMFMRHAAAIRVFTIAPELPSALPFIAQLKERGVVVSAGHSVAIDSELENAVAAGLSHGTHLFCNMGSLRRANLRRVAGLVESVLLDDRISAEIITDGYHIAPSLMKLAFKAKGSEHLAVITDGSHLTGLPPGLYRDSGIDIVLEESIAYLADRTAYAGSAATMDHCLRVAIAEMGLSLSDALRMVSLTPAQILGVSQRKGSLQPGKDADVVILDQQCNVQCTVVRGRVWQWG